MLTITEPDRFEKSLGITKDGYRRDWRACSGCGASINEHLAVNAAKLGEIAKSYYEVDLGNGIDAKYRRVMGLPDDKSDNTGRVRRVLQKLLSMRAAQGVAQNAPLKVADIGAGTGVFLSRLHQLCHEQGIALDALAIEPDPIAAAHLRKLQLMRVEETILDENFKETGFDLVTFNKVLEHIEYPVPVVIQASRIMNKETGLLYAEVPGVETIQLRPSNDNILGALHHHLYAITSMDRMLLRAGLVSLEVQRITEPSSKLTVFGFAVTRDRFESLATA